MLPVPHPIAFSRYISLYSLADQVQESSGAICLRNLRSLLGGKEITVAFTVREPCEDACEWTEVSRIKAQIREIKVSWQDTEAFTPFLHCICFFPFPRLRPSILCYLSLGFSLNKKLLEDNLMIAEISSCTTKDFFGRALPLILPFYWKQWEIILHCQ